MVDMLNAPGVEYIVPQINCPSSHEMVDVASFVFS